MKKIVFLSFATVLLTSCSGAEVSTEHLNDEPSNEADSSAFTELCSQKGGIVEVAGEPYCTLDYNGDGAVDSSEYCSYSSFTAGECSLELPASDESLTEETLEELVEVEEVQIPTGGEVLSPYITRVRTCDLSGTEIYDDGCWYPMAVFLDENGEQYPVPAGTVNQAGTGWVYMEEHTIFTYDIVSGESQELMSVLDTTDGVSFEWSPDDSKLAIVVVNQLDESYRETYGSKLFMFSFDSEGSVLKKDRYLFKIKYGCHSAGCDSSPGEDFYFVDEDTLIYYTWEGDPYVERTAEYKRTVEL